VPSFILLCLLLGGSPQGIWRNAVLQLLAAGLLACILLSEPAQHSLDKAVRSLLLFAFIWFALLLAQLLPLPPDLWSGLPGREMAVLSFTLRGEPLPWLPLSLTPAKTAAALPIMLVPLAVFAGILLRGSIRTCWCIAALLAGAFVSVTLGAVQLIEGGPYLYPIHNSGASGLFANSNHQGMLLLVTIPYLAAMTGREPQKSRGGWSRLAMAFGALIVVLLGIVLNGSLAAVALLLPVALASAAIGPPGLPRLHRLLGSLTLALLLAATALLAWKGEAGSSETSLSSRAEIYQRTAAAISDTMPLGTGLGSFEVVYRQYEDRAQVDAFYVNAAHSDPLQWLLDTGVPGALLLAAFLGWWLVQAWRACAGCLESRLAKAGAVASAAILAHSLVDYPLRDPAIQALFAMSLAFMVTPRKHRLGKAPRHLGLANLEPLSA
jgi:O-antigen ligase